MPTLVSTGQITIIDQNDAKNITAFIGASGPVQQVHTKNNGVITYTPDYTTANLTLTAYVYAGSTTNIAPTLSNRKWSTTVGGTSIGGNTTLVINTNLPENSAAVTYYFEGDYTDTTTGLVTKVLSTIVVSQVKTGSNAVYVQIRGQNVILESDTATKNVIAIGADLVRSSGYDTDNLTYKWYESNGATQITTAIPSVSTKYGLKGTTAGSAVTGTTAELNVGLPAVGGSNTYANGNTLVIGEAAVTDLGVFKVEITDTVEGTTYATFFTVIDSTDPYELVLVSTAGDTFKNGVGSTTVYPRVYSGSTEIAASDATASQFQSWSFNYFFYDKDGFRGAFIDTTKTALAGGRTITASSAVTTGVFTVDFSGTALTFLAGEIVKLVKSDGTAEFYETNAAVTVAANQVPLKAVPTLNTWLKTNTTPTLNSFQNGRFYACTGPTAGALGGAQIKTVPSSGITTLAAARAAAQITVTGDEVDAKGTIICEANRP